jgi:hypothetical protein
MRVFNPRAADNVQDDALNALTIAAEGGKSDNTKP